MKLELIELEEFSGDKTKIYSVFIDDGSDCLFDAFLKENEKVYSKEIEDLVTRLETIGHETGLRENFYKPNEGKPGDGICALFDQPNSNLRLYFIKYGQSAIILGSGGLKPKSIRALQEDLKLTDENYLLRKISSILSKAIQNKDLVLTDLGFKSENDFIFNSEDYE